MSTTLKRDLDRLLEELQEPEAMPEDESSERHIVIHPVEPTEPVSRPEEPTLRREEPTPRPDGSTPRSEEPTPHRPRIRIHPPVPVILQKPLNPISGPNVKSNPAAPEGNWDEPIIPLGNRNPPADPHRNQNPPFRVVDDWDAGESLTGDWDDPVGRNAEDCETDIQPPGGPSGRFGHFFRGVGREKTLEMILLAVTVCMGLWVLVNFDAVSIILAAAFAWIAIKLGSFAIFIGVVFGGIFLLLFWGRRRRRRWWY